MQSATGRKVTMLQYYQYMIAHRGASNPILHAGHLFQQYIVDAYVKVEATRLHYQRFHQGQLRAESYRGLMDYLANVAEEENAVVRSSYRLRFLEDPER